MKRAGLRRALMLPALAVVATALGLGSASAQEELNGKRLYMKKTCIACHGLNGAKAILDYPNLAGQEKDYLVNQMKDIKSGKRVGSPDDTGNPRTAGMEGVMHLVSDEEMEAIAEWLSGLPPAKPKQTEFDAERVAQGEQIYNKNNCRTCHGPEGKRPLKAHPYVAQQKAAYIVRQMVDIREKVRTNGRSQTMWPFVRKLSDEDIAAVAEYLAQVQR